MLSKLRSIWQSWRAKRTSSMRRHIFVTFAIPYLLLFSLLMWVAERTASDNAIASATSRFEQVGQRTSESLFRIEEPARAWLAAMTRNPAQGIHGVEDLALLRVHMTLLSRSPHMASVYFGYGNGEFARVVSLSSAETRQAVKAPEAARYAVQFVRPLAGALAQESLEFYNAAMLPLAASRSQGTEFDPRTRPWYAAAHNAKVGDAVATPPYMFAFPRVLGVTMSANLGNGDEAVGPAKPMKTVGGVDFSLASLSRYLGEQKSLKSVQAYIFDETGHLWAWSDAARYDKLLASGTVPRVENLPEPAQRQLLKTALSQAAKRKPEGGYVEIEAEGGTRMAASIVSVPRLGSQRVFVAVTDPTTEVFADVAQLRLRLLVLGLVGLIGGALVIALLARRIARPLRLMAVQTKLLERFRFNDFSPGKSRIKELAQLQSSLSMARAALSGYARFMPKPLVRHYLALRSEPKPGVESREVVAMYGMFRQPLHLPSGQNSVGFEALSAVLQHVEGARGVADRIDNDGVGALWNAPLIQNNPALRACEAAYQAIEWLDRHRANDQAPWPVFIGIDMGMASVGNFGTPTGRLIYTAAGQPMHRASDLALHARRLSVPLLITEPVAQLVGKYYELRPLDLPELRVPCYGIARRSAGTEAMKLSGAEGMDATDFGASTRGGASERRMRHSDRRDLDSLGSDPQSVPVSTPDLK